VCFLSHDEETNVMKNEKMEIQTRSNPFDADDPPMIDDGFASAFVVVGCARRHSATKVKVCATQDAVLDLVRVDVHGDVARRADGAQNRTDG